VKHLLDTNVCIAYLNGRETGVRNTLLALSPASVFLCSVVKAELLYGARGSSRVRQNLERLAAFFAHMSSLPFDDEAAEHYGLIRSSLERAGISLGANDLMIASICLAHDAVLLTRNLGEFRQVPGLRIDAC
jgi:tRNA(fMet)-specific endonuclease VapC